MDADGGKRDPSLPAGYVSLAQLKEQWVRKQQQEKNLEEEKGISSGTANESRSGRVSENEGDEKMGGGGRPKMMAVVEVTERGKAIAAGGVEGGDANEAKEKKVKKNRKFRKKKSEGDGEKGKEKSDGGGFEEAEIVAREDVERRGDYGGFRRNGGDPGLLGNRGGRRGFRRNAGNRAESFSWRRGGKGCGVRVDGELKESQGGLDLGQKMGGDKNPNEWGGMKLGRNAFDGLEHCVDALKVSDEGKPEGDKKIEEGSMEVSGGVCVVDGREGGYGGSKMREHVIEEGSGSEKLGVRDGFKRRGGGRWRGNRGRKFHGPTNEDWEGGNVQLRAEGKGRYGKRYARYGNRHREDSRKVWVKKGETPGIAAAENVPSGTCGDQQ